MDRELLKTKFARERESVLIQMGKFCTTLAWYVSIVVFDTVIRHFMSNFILNPLLTASDYVLVLWKNCKRDVGIKIGESEEWLK